MSMLSPASRRILARAEIKDLGERLAKAVDRSLVYEVGELVQSDSPQGPIVMEVLGRAKKSYATYMVRLPDGQVIEREARYFQEYKPQLTVPQPT